MNAVFSPSAESILARYIDFRDGLLKAIEDLPGQCFIEGKVGRIPSNDEIVVRCQGRDPIIVEANELKDVATPARVAKQLSQPPE